MGTSAEAPGTGPDDARPGLGAHRAGGLDDDDLDRIRTGLRQAADLHQRMHRLLDAVLSISGELELSSVLHTIADAARALVDARHGALGVLNEEGDFAELIPSGEGAEGFAALGLTPHGEGILGELVRNPRPLRVDSLASHPHAAGLPAGHPVLETLLGVPILVRGVVYGNLYLADKNDGSPFTEADESVVSALAGAAGVAIENARLYRRLREATEEFQRRLLPDLPDLGALHLEARYQPSSEIPRVGGDWYDLIRLPDGAPCLMIGDVMGHDLHAATVMSQISNMLRVIAFDEQEPPSRILHRLDEVLHRLHGGPMATVLVARLDEQGPDHWRLWWASAGHLPPLLITPDGRARYLYGGESGIPLGVDPDLPRPDHHETVTSGSTLLLFTDGLIEHPRHSLDRGMGDLARVAEAMTGRPLPDLCDALLGHRGGVFHDDVALLALRLAP
ncbi:PP2C family protein-serine/threonine phosphatase [Peterkaempfera bronchialis]|uniref:protein-serine/threonine phosphatase n=1 Tax=Peterkaempfera bronchialis TaxID=2126346 RepID=A0A345T245_9ACTN|nr:GAF domain-containing SpoIIE family protein phosphatase [Peterkaempfera bronchialis]AXI80050.1 GAF domain-containing protein [Peterkaempfera bronchialis]